VGTARGSRTAPDVGGRRRGDRRGDREPSTSDREEFAFAAIALFVLVVEIFEHARDRVSSSD
jgi:hypothetical protein